MGTQKDKQIYKGCRISSKKKRNEKHAVHIQYHGK